MHKIGQLTRAALVTGALALAAAPAAAQAAGAAAGVAAPTVVERIDANNIVTEVVQGLPLVDVAPEASTLRLTVPEGAELVAVERQEDDYNIAIALRAGVDTNELFEYYRRLMAQQGYQMVSVDYGVEGGGLFEDPFDNEHIQAVFVRNPDAAGVPVRSGLYRRGPVDTRRGDRVDMLIDREGAYSYVVYAEPQGYAGRQGVQDSPLYEDGPTQRQGAGEGAAAGGLPGYEFYGPIGFRGVEGLQPDPTRIRFAAPEGVSAFQLERLDPDRFVYRYKVRGGLREVYGFYNRLLQEQGFERVSGTLGEQGGDFIYANGDRRVRVGLNAAGDGLYSTVVDLQPGL